MGLLDFSDSDLRVLREVVSDYHRRRANAPKPWVAELDYLTPETYIAWPPDGGIPALSTVGTAGPTGGDDEPGSAVCDIYRLNRAEGTPDLEVVTGMDRTVYNLSAVKVPRRWILITRTKFGAWIVTWAPHQARWIKFTVNDGSGFATTDSSVTVDGVTYVDGFEPDNEITTVYNEPASSDYIFEGDDDDVGQAVYDPGNDKYWIRMVECP